MRIMGKYIKRFIEILDWKFNPKGISFYEMSYIEGKNLDLNNIRDRFLTKKLCQILSTLYDQLKK